MFERYPDYEYLLARIQLVLFMLGMGATLRGWDFLNVMRRPGTLLMALGCHFLFVPLLAVVINHLAGLEPGTALGLLLVALMPGGSVSKVFSHLGRGNMALTITLSVVTTLASVLTVPLLLRALAGRGITSEFTVSWDLVVPDVAVYLLLPLVTGMLLSRFFPEQRRAFSRSCVAIGWFFVTMMVVGSLGSGRIHPGDYGWRAPVAIILFCVIAQQASMAPFYVLRWPRPDRLAVGIEVTMRNMNLALLLKALLFPAEKDVDAVGDAVLFVVLYYAAVAMFAGLPLALNHWRLARREQRREAHGA
jgi:BASS family bile acid:Na+ symporter